MINDFKTADGRRYINNDHRCPNSKEDKSRPRNKLNFSDVEPKLIKVVESATNSHDYARQVAFIASRSRANPDILNSNLDKPDFVHQTAKLFPVSKTGGGKTLPISPYIEEEIDLVAAENDIPDADISADIKPLRMVLGGDHQGTTHLFDVVRTDKVNEHYNTSYLKRYLSCLIVANDWYSVSLVNQRWLNHRGTNGLVITGAFVTSYVERFIDRLVESGCTFLFVTEKYTPGLYIGDQYSYYCDANGVVVGTSRGAPTKFWTDKSDPWGSRDYYKGYSIETLATFGTQRIILMKPTDSIIVPEDFVVPGCPVTQGTGKLIPAKEPNSLCALVRYKDEEEIVPEDEDYEEEDLEDEMNVALIDVPEDSFYIQACEDPLNHKAFWGMVASTILVYTLSWYELLPVFYSAIPISFYAGYYMLTKMQKPEEILVKLTGYEVKFYGKDAEMLRAWYKRNRIDPVTKLPYGWYKITSRGIVQVRQGSHHATYTNVPRLIRSFCYSHNWPQTSFVSHYAEMTMSVAPVFDYKGNFEVMTQVDPEIKILMGAYNVRVNAPIEKEQIDLHLSDDSNYREYITALINKTTIAASAMKRVARAGLRSIYPAAHHRDLVIAMWNDQHLGKIECVDSAPDLSEYSGSKLRKYENAFENKAHFSDEACYSTFIKSEALPAANVFKKGNRVITQNNPAFNCRTLNWMKQMEHKVLSMVDPRTGLKLIAKGSNCDTRSETILSLANQFGMFASIDFKNCDGHFNGTSYQGVVESFALLGLPAEDVTSILNAKTYGVIQYQNPQQRSGDLFTGSGNCLLVASMLYPFLSDDFSFYCDGDDTLLFFNNPDILKEVETSLTRLGFEIEIETTRDCDTSIFSDMVIPFCQTYYTTRGYYVDLHRRINKLCNITAPNALVAARTILGKLQGLEMLSKLGVDLHIDVAPLIHGKSENEQVVHTEEMYAGLTHYDQQCVVDFDLTDKRTGIIAKAVCAIRDDYTLKLLRMIGRKESKAYHRQVLHVLEQLVKKHMSFDFIPASEDNYYDEPTIERLMNANRLSVLMSTAKRR
jgi:hypothetical protein